MRAGSRNISPVLIALFTALWWKHIHKVTKWGRTFVVVSRGFNKGKMALTVKCYVVTGLLPCGCERNVSVRVCACVCTICVCVGHTQHKSVYQYCHDQRVKTMARCYRSATSTSTVTFNPFGCETPDKSLFRLYPAGHRDQQERTREDQENVFDLACLVLVCSI